MKKLFTLSALFMLCLTTMNGQNLKFGKPTDEEMTMAVYDADKDAAAVVLCQLTTVDYTMDLNNYMVNYNVKTRIKVLKDEGKDVY